MDKKRIPSDTSESGDAVETDTEVNNSSAPVRTAPTADRVTSGYTSLHDAARDNACEAAEILLKKWC